VGRRPWMGNNEGGSAEVYVGAISAGPQLDEKEFQIRFRV